MKRVEKEIIRHQEGTFENNDQKRIIGCLYLY